MSVLKIDSQFTLRTLVLFLILAVSCALQLHHVSSDGTQSHLSNTGNIGLTTSRVPVLFTTDVHVSTANASNPENLASFVPWWPAFQNLASLQRKAVKALWPLDGRDAAMFAVLAFSLSLAGGAGIGGGAILVPTFILVRRECSVWEPLRSLVSL
jgi:hypothetical protein